MFTIKYAFVIETASFEAGKLQQWNALRDQPDPYRWNQRGLIVNISFYTDFCFDYIVQITLIRSAF